MINTIQNKYTLVTLCKRMNAFCMSVFFISVGAYLLSHFNNEFIVLTTLLTVIAFIVTSYFYDWTFSIYVAFFPSRNKVVDLEQYYNAIQPSQLGDLRFAMLKINNQFMDFTFTQHPSLIIH